MPAVSAIPGARWKHAQERSAPGHSHFWGPLSRHDLHCQAGEGPFFGLFDQTNLAPQQAEVDISLDGYVGQLIGGALMIDKDSRYAKCLRYRDSDGDSLGMRFLIDTSPQFDDRFHTVTDLVFWLTGIWERQNLVAHL